MLWGTGGLAKAFVRIWEGLCEQEREAETGAIERKREKAGGMEDGGTGQGVGSISGCK